MEEGRKMQIKERKNRTTETFVQSILYSVNVQKQITQSVTVLIHPSVLLSPTPARAWRNTHPQPHYTNRVNISVMI